MARVWLTSGAVAVFVAYAFAGCGDTCETGACDALQKPRSHSQISQGVVGVIAAQSDVCENDCCECSYADAELRLMEAAEPVTQQNAASIAAQSKSSKTIHAHHDYALELDRSDWLLCTGGKGADDSCAGLHITAGDVFTVNVQQVFGPASVIVFGPHDEDSRDDLVFNVPHQQ